MGEMHVCGELVELKANWQIPTDPTIPGTPPKTTVTSGTSVPKRAANLVNIVRVACIALSIAARQIPNRRVSVLLMTATAAIGIRVRVMLLWIPNVNVSLVPHSVRQTTALTAKPQNAGESPPNNATSPP